MAVRYEALSLAQQVLEGLTAQAEDAPEELRVEAEETEVLTRALLARRPGAGPRPDGSLG